MTQLRKFRDAISNYFDDLEKGIGKRGSSFMDIDGISHNADNGSFLFREFKEEGEVLSEGQKRTLRALSALPRCTVWFVRRINGGQCVGFATAGKPEEVISVDEYRHRLRQWWGNAA